MKRITIDVRKLAFMLLENAKRDEIVKGDIIEDYIWTYFIDALDSKCNNLNSKLAIMADYALDISKDRKIEYLSKKGYRGTLFYYCLKVLSNNMPREDRVLDVPKDFEFGLNQKMLVDLYLGMFENRNLIRLVPKIKNKSDAKALLIIDYIYSRSFKKENLEKILAKEESIKEKLNLISKIYKENFIFELAFQTKKFAKKSAISFYENLKRPKRALAFGIASFAIFGLATIGYHHFNKRADGGICYVVVENGDTLSKIAQRYLGSYKLWPKLAKYNERFYKNFDPDVIKVGQKIYFPCEMLRK